MLCKFIVAFAHCDTILLHTDTLDTSGNFVVNPNWIISIYELTIRLDLCSNYSELLGWLHDPKKDYGAYETYVAFGADFLNERTNGGIKIIVQIEEQFI